MGICYRESEFDLNFEILNHKLDVLKSKYNRENHDLIKEMLIIDENKRPDFVQLERIVNQTAHHTHVSPPVTPI
jgi:hypothetical protein